MEKSKTTDKQSINEPAATYSVDETALKIPPQLTWLLDFDNAEQQRFLQELLNAAATAQQTGDWTSIAKQIETWKTKEAKVGGAGGKLDFGKRSGGDGLKASLAFAGLLREKGYDAMVPKVGQTLVVP